MSDNLSSLDILLRLMLAVFASGVIGFEREQHKHPAGLRTHILVGLGAAVVALMESYGLAQVITLGAGAASISVGRMTAQVISGIGFLGAGTILVHKRSVSGLTTAASLWNTACLGIAAGYGCYNLCLIGSGATLLVLSLIRRLVPLREQRRIEISFTNPSETVPAFTRLFVKYNLNILNTNYSAAHEGAQSSYKHVYLLEFPPKFEFTGFFLDVFAQENVVYVKMIDD